MPCGLPFIWVDRQIKGVLRSGVDRHSLLDAAFIDESQREQRGWVTPAQWLLLCRMMTTIMNDATHGLADSPIAPAHGPLGLRLALGSETLEASIRAVGKFYNFVSDAIHIGLDVSGCDARVIVTVNSGEFDSKLQLEECYIQWIFAHCLYYLGGEFPVSCVETKDKDHFSIGVRHFGIGGIVKLGAETAFSFPKRILSRRSSTRAGENAYWECVKLWLDFVDGKNRSDLQGQPGAPLSLNELAQSTGVSTSTMRRRIERKFGTFRHMRKSAIIAKADDLLYREAYSIGAIADELGYSDARAFRRFYVNATGVTPSERRMELARKSVERENAIRGKLQKLGQMIAF